MKNVKIGSTLRIRIPEYYQAKESKMDKEWVVIVSAPEGVKPNIVWGSSLDGIIQYGLEIKEIFIDQKKEIDNSMIAGKESKMTREEAIKEFRKALKETASYSEGLIKGLETLGLIKFEEEFTPEDVFKQYYHTPKAITNHLDRMGFKVVKK